MRDDIITSLVAKHLSTARFRKVFMVLTYFVLGNMYILGSFDTFNVYNLIY